MLRFCNNYSTTVWVCIEWYHPNCEDGGDWEKAGWWQIEPGQCKVAFGNDLEDVNRYWYYFVTAADGAFWAGPFADTVPDTAFDWCINTSSTASHQIGFRELDIGDDDNHIVNLIA